MMIGVRIPGVERLDPQRVKVAGSWTLPDGFFSGARLRLLAAGEKTFPVVGYEGATATLELAAPLPDGVEGAACELEIGEDSVAIDLFLVVRAVDMLALSHKVQQEIMRTMDRIVGIEVDAVNIHIEDVAYPGNGPS